jgi:membrane fusion protein (multidrug efflux system)
MKNNNRAGLMTAASVLAVGLILGGCGQKSTGPPLVPEVAVVTIKLKQVVTTTELSGRTSANLMAEVRPQVNGIIQKCLFTEGSIVQAGQELFQIDPSLYQAALARVEANFAALQLKVNRMRELLADKAVSQQEYDDATAALKQTQAEIQTARINLGYTTITAPISGRIGKSSVTAGALVTAQQPVALATIQKLDPMYVDVPQSTIELLQLQHRLQEGRLAQNVKNQKKVRLFLEDGTAYPLTGTLQFRDVTVDPSTGSVILRIVFPNPKGILLPGMFVRTIVQEGINKRALLVPQQAISRDPKGNPLVWIVDEKGKVQLRTLTLDRTIGDAWLVSAGLEPGEQVIVEGLQKVKPGVSVKVVPFEGDEEKKSEGLKGKNRPSAKVN